MIKKNNVHGILGGSKMKIVKKNNILSGKKRKNQKAKSKKLHLASLNKWSMSFAVTLVILSAYMGIAKVSQSQNDEILYVLDTVPTEVTSVVADISGDSEVADDGNTQVEGSEDGAVANTEVANLDGAEIESGTSEVEVGEDISDDIIIEETGAISGENSVESIENSDVSEDATTQTVGELLNGSEVADPSSYAINNDSDFFINYRLEREKNRSEQLELLNAIISDTNTSSEMRSQTQEKIIAITEAMENELLLENILVAKYGGEAVVFVQSEKINVVLSGDATQMSASEAAKIAEMVNGYTAIGFENVIVVIKS